LEDAQTHAQLGVSLEASGDEASAQNEFSQAARLLGFKDVQDARLFGKELLK
jgi:hypothetical protein